MLGCGTQNSSICLDAASLLLLLLLLLLVGGRGTRHRNSRPCLGHKLQGLGGEDRGAEPVPMEPVILVEERQGQNRGEEENLIEPEAAVGWGVKHKEEVGGKSVPTARANLKP